MGNTIVVLVSKTVRTAFQLDRIFEIYGADKDLFVFDHIGPDAPFDDLDLVLNSLNDNKPDGLIAIGGGSIIDAGKALSVAFEGISYVDLFYGKAQMPDSKIPLLAVPTTAGTGAELSFGAIIYDRKHKKKGGLRGPILQPNAVIIDSRLHNTCPFKLKAEVGFDCLTHAVETYISKKSNPIVRMQSVSCIQTIFQNLIPACEDQDIKAMEKVAISSALMGINLAFSSTCLPHRIQYVIGPHTGTSHAQGLIALYRGWLWHLQELNMPEWSCLADDLNTSPQKFLQKVHNLKTRLDIDYTLSDLGVSYEELGNIASKVTGTLNLDPSYKDKSSIINILEKSY